MTKDEFHSTEPWTPDMGWRPPEHLVQTLCAIAGNLGILESIEKNDLSITLSPDKVEEMRQRRIAAVQRLKISFLNELNGVWDGDPKKADKWLSEKDPKHKRLSECEGMLEWVLQK